MRVSTFFGEVYGEAGLLVLFLLVAQNYQTLTQRSGGITVLRWGQVVQQLRPQHLPTTEYTHVNYSGLIVLLML